MRSKCWNIEGRLFTEGCEVQSGKRLYDIDYALKGARYIEVSGMSLRKVQGGHSSGSSTLDFAKDPSRWARDARITGPLGNPICIVRRGSTFKFTYHDKLYRSEGGTAQDCFCKLSTCLPSA